MTDIHHQIGVKAELKDIHAAITTLEGLSSWWTRASGDTASGGTLTFHFADNRIDMKILELSRTKVTWQCMAEAGEWKNTIISFELVESGDQIFINFSHSRWAQQTTLCAHCNTKWAIFLLSLKAYLEKGEGRPFPNDIHINHTDF